MKKKVLVVEDEESLRLLYEEELKGEGYEILTAGNGKEAIQQLEAGRPDLIILDILLPKMNGLQVLSEIRRQGLSFPVLLLTVIIALSAEIPLPVYSIRLP